VEGLEPPYLAAVDPKSTASTNFATPAFEGAKLRVFFKLTSFYLIILKNIFDKWVFAQQIVDKTKEMSKNP
jgi:hypothetical protein